MKAPVRSHPVRGAVDFSVVESDMNTIPTFRLSAAALATGLLLGSGIQRARAAPPPQYTDVAWLIEHPCQSWHLQDDGSAQPEARCDGVYAGDRASINVPAPLVHAQLPELGLVDLPIVVQLGWSPGTFDYADSARRTISWSKNRIEGYRIELALSPYAGLPTILESTARQGNLAVHALDERLRLFSRDRYRRAVRRLVAGRPARQPGGPGAVPGVFRRRPASGRADRRAGGQPCSPATTGRGPIPSAAGGSPAGRSGPRSAVREATTAARRFGSRSLPGWALFARVQWDVHWRQLSQTEQHCGWEYYGEPGWYWDWDQWPPVCIDVTTTTWKKYCPPNNPQPGCPTITYGVSSDWWQLINSFEAHTIRLQDGGFGRYLDVVVLQSQPLLTGP